ncbi:MAG TPA: hypothetical protein VGM03_19670 [Phycisphaerae bacterium]|jgi:uncharacterized protein YbjQ (UPF0145 family)
MLPQSLLPDWLDQKYLIAAATLLVLFLLLRRIRWSVRRRRPAVINPKLAKYAGRSEAEINAELEAARKIIATSSTGQIAGYRMVRQIEAVFVEGLRTSEEAVLALKAAAARRGANALINLTQQRTTAGRCAAQGDAIYVQPEETGDQKGSGFGVQGPGQAET